MSLQEQFLFQIDEYDRKIATVREDLMRIQDIILETRMELGIALGDPPVPPSEARSLDREPIMIRTRQKISAGSLPSACMIVEEGELGTPPKDLPPIPDEQNRPHEQKDALHGESPLDGPLREKGSSQERSYELDHPLEGLHGESPHGGLRDESPSANCWKAYKVRSSEKEGSTREEDPSESGPRSPEDEAVRLSWQAWQTRRSELEVDAAKAWQEWKDAQAEVPIAPKPSRLKRICRKVRATLRSGTNEDTRSLS